MNYKNCIKLTIGVLAAACTILSASTAQAGYSFHVSVNTSPLISLPANAPYALDFQLNNGGSLVTNTVTISNFTFGGGAATNNPLASAFGTATGTLPSPITLTSNLISPFNEFYQGFAPGSTLGFDVSLTTNVGAAAPDAFSFAILDQNLANIPTTGLGDSLVLVNITSNRPNLQGFSGTGVYAAVNANVPEPRTTLIGILACGVALTGVVNHRRKAQA